MSNKNDPNHSEEAAHGLWAAARTAQVKAPAKVKALVLDRVFNPEHKAPVRSDTAVNAPLSGVRPTSSNRKLWMASTFVVLLATFGALWSALHSSYKDNKGASQLAQSPSAISINTAQDNREHSARVLQPVAVRVDLKSLPGREAIVSAMVHLPVNVEFFSKNSPEIGQLKNLKLPVKVAMEKLPVVIKGAKAGHQEVSVDFYDASNRLVGQRKVAILFEEGASQ